MVVYVRSLYGFVEFTPKYSSTISSNQKYLYIIPLNFAISIVFVVKLHIVYSSLNNVFLVSLPIVIFLINFFCQSIIQHNTLIQGHFPPKKTPNFSKCVM